MKRIGSVAVAAVLVSATARMAMAQLPGIPYSPVETGTGISVAADYGSPGSGASAYGVTGGLGVSNFGISASVGAAKAGSGLPSQTSFGGRVGMKLFGGGLNPLTIGVQAGASSVKDLSGLTTSRTTVFLPAAFVRVSPPLFPLKPWGVVYYTAGNSSVKKEVRFTVGANFNLLLGLGVHGGYDWGDSGHTWGVGAHFNFHVPGLGVPGVPGM
jgi:hypothetical protein